MKFKRIIPRLDIKGKDLVKGIHLEGLRVLGDPEEYALKYSEMGADEIIYQDVVASLYGRNSILDLVSRTARNCFIPLTVGGGIRDLNDIESLLRSGADKVSINTAAINNPSLIEEASKTFGSSTIVVAIEAIFYQNKYLAFTDNGREQTGIEVLQWVKEAQNRGAGEILLTSIDKEGTGKGFKSDLIREVSKIITIPLIIHGGAGSVNHLIEIEKVARIDAFAVASLFHYSLLERNLITQKRSETGNTSFLDKKTKYGEFQSSSIKEAKDALTKAGVLVRDKW